MGSQTSKTRRLSFDNDEPTNVIKVSDEVVTRLRTSAKEVRQKHAGEHQPPMYATAPAEPPLPFYEPTLTTLQIRQEAADKLKKNDEYWEGRIHDLEKRHEKMKIIMEEEFKKASEEVEVKRIRTPTGKCEVPCKDIRANVVACYKKYPNEPMRCAKEVLAFTKCVDTKRVSIVEEARCVQTS